MTTNTKYDYDRVKRLQEDRKTKLDAARDIVARAQKANRDLDPAETDAVEAAMQAVKNLDAELADQRASMMREVLGSPGDRGGSGDTMFMSVRTPRVKSDLTAQYGHKLGVPGMKALLDPAQTYTSVEMDPQPYSRGRPPTSLIEILPAVVRPVTYRFMRQTTRTQNAAPVAAGALKPTSVYGLTPVDGRLQVVAHLSEPIAKYDLADGPSLASFVQQQMVEGLHEAVEAQVVTGNGTAPNLRGLANTSGIQTQAWTTSMLLTCRAAITKLEVLSFQPYYYVLHPSDWEAIETSTDANETFMLNVGGTAPGVPVESATRRLWGVPVTLTTAVTAGTGYLLATDAAQLVSDGNLETEMSSEHSDDWGKNLVRLRVESRFDLAVTRPLGVVQVDLTAA